MKKIDVSKIEGYAEMTAEEKVKALEEYEVEETVIDNSADEKQKLKDAITNATKEAAEYKRKWQATLSEQEKERISREERLKSLEAENAEFRKQKRISDYTAQFMGAGYDEATAKAMAANLPEGIGEDFFTAQKDFIAAQRQKMAVDAINSTPKPTAGSPLTGNDAFSAEQAKMRQYFGLK